MSNVKAGQFGDRRDARQTLLTAIDDADDLELVVVVAVRRGSDKTIQVSWSDGGKLEVMGALALGQAMVREHFQ